MPMPPPTSSGRSTSSRKPLPSGPKTWIALARLERAERLRPRADRLEEERELAGRREAERERARQEPSRRLEHEELSRNARVDAAAVERGAACTAPTASTPATLRRSRLGIDPLLERERLLGARVRDRVHRRGGAGRSS